MMSCSLTVCRFAESVIKAQKGEKNILEPTYVYLPGVPGGDAIAKETGVEFFSVPVELGVSRSSMTLIDFGFTMLTPLKRPTVLRRLSTSSRASPTRRISCWRLPSRASRATLRKALTSSTTLPQSKYPLPVAGYLSVHPP